MNTGVGILVLLGIIFIGLYGGQMNQNGGILKIPPIVPTATTTVDFQPVVTTEPLVPSRITVSGVSTGTTPKPTPTIVVDPTKSKYDGYISIRSVNRYGDQNSEYIQLRTSSNASTSVPITGWTIKSESSGRSITIPKATYLFFADSANTEDPIVLGPNETVYLTTGYSPNGVSFKLNKCSGYLSQFLKWDPWLPGSCPAPRYEDLSSIPKTLNNDACFDYIDRMSSCRIQTSNLPANWSYECVNFIYSKINYPSCVNIHKNDKDFYKGEWRIFLKRSEKLWKSSRESIVLIDEDGKIVSRYTY